MKPATTYSVITIYQRYGWITLPVLIYALLFSLTGHYIAILISNIAFWVFFMNNDFRSAFRCVDLENALKERSDQLLTITLPSNDPGIRIAKSTGANLSPAQIDIRPKHFFENTVFITAFQLKYIAEDTKKFIASYTSRLGQQVWISIAAALIIIVVFNNDSHKIQNEHKPIMQNTVFTSPYENHIREKRDFQQVSMIDNSELDEPKRITITLSIVLLNILFSIRPYLQYKERNNSIL